MFSNKAKNIEIVEGAFKKIKSLYYYSKDKLFERLKIAEFENNVSLVDETFAKLADYLAAPLTAVAEEYIEALLKKIDYYVFPKTFKPRYDAVKNGTITNVQEHMDLTKVNFLINLPIELMILECIWTLMIGKISYDNNSVSSCNYACIFQVNQIYNNNYSLIEAIDFKSNRLFVRYFKQYSSWGNNALKALDKLYEDGKDAVMISLDISNYFYSATFKFSDLKNLLNNDIRLSSIEFLSSAIEKIYILYTKLIKKVRDSIIADVDNEECIFPFQMVSSCFLANLYLNSFDKKVNGLSNLKYYGRYVDDMLLIFESDSRKNNQKEQNELIEQFLVNKHVLEVQERGNFGIPETNLKINHEKIKTFYFDHKQPKILLEYMKSKMLVNVSTVNFFDDEIEIEGFNNNVYRQEKQYGYSKFKDFSLLISDNYNATRYLYKLINMNKNVKKPFIEENQNIFDFYSYTKCLEFRGAWTLIFSLGVMQSNKQFITDFYNQVKEQIDELESNKIANIFLQKKNGILNKIKNSLLMELEIAMGIALAVNITLISKDKIKRIAMLIRKANLFNHHLISYPLLNYTKGVDNENFSLAEIDISKIPMESLELDERKLYFSPRFIHFEDINIFHFIKTFSKGGNLFNSQIKEIFDKFKDFNSITPDLEIDQQYADAIETISYNSMSRVEHISVGIASVLLDEDECFNVVEDSKYLLTIERKKELFRLLKTAESNQANIVVLPELYVPIAWIGDVSNFARRAGFIIVAGLQYIKHNKRVYNFIANIQPFYTSKNILYKNIFTHIREKYDYAPFEKEKLKEYDLQDSKKDWVIIHNLRGQFSYSNQLCYEFTNISNRAKLKNKVEIICVPELNRDTSYFSNIIDATVRDNLCFIAQSNTSKYGDSSLTGPYKAIYKNIMKIKGAKNNNMLIDDVEILELVKYKSLLRDGKSFEQANSLARGLKEGKAPREFKKPSARFLK